MSKKSFDCLQQALGLNYGVENLCFDDSLRSLVKPVTHCLRDWFHMVLSGGVGGTEVALFLKAMQSEGAQLPQLIDYAMLFRLPKNHGKKVHRDWFSKSHILEDQMRTASASDLIPMVTLLQAYSVDVLQKTHILQDNIECLTLLKAIIELLTLAAESAPQRVTEINELILEHHARYSKLYPDSVKPKAHNLLHLPSNISHLGRLLACFVTERKHREVKAAAVHIFSNFEKTVLANLINGMAERISNGESNFGLRAIASRPLELFGQQIRISNVAHATCGDLHSNDIICTRCKRVGKVQMFCNSSDNESGIDSERALVSFYESAGTAGWFHLEPITETFVPVCMILVAVPWAIIDGKLRALLPVCQQ